MNTNFFRIVVIDVIYDPIEMIKNGSELAAWYSTIGLRNQGLLKNCPRNTVIGKRILGVNGIDNVNLEVFFPFFPAHLSLPCKPGEHMWAFVESSDSTIAKHGYWMCKITEQWHVDDLNHTHPPRQWEPTLLNSGQSPILEFNNGQIVIDKNGKRKIKRNSQFLLLNNYPKDSVYSILVDQSVDQFNSSRLTPSCAAPRFKKRPGDLALEGSNNTLIVLGTNRAGPVAEYSTSPIRDSNNKLFTIRTPNIPFNDDPSGCIDMVAGRRNMGKIAVNSLGLFEVDKSYNFTKEFENEGDPNLKTDKSRIRISESTKIDVDLGIDNFNKSNFSISTDDNAGGIIIKSDSIRMVARKDLEILVADDFKKSDSYAAILIKADGNIVFKPSEKGYIKLGSDEADKALMCTDLPAQAKDGSVSAFPVITDGNSAVCTGQFGQGKFARKILVD